MVKIMIVPLTFVLHVVDLGI